MTKHYPWLWFDADGTLFDYELAEVTAFRRTFETFATPYQDTYLDTYRQINSTLWQALERQEITPADLRVRRFEVLADTLQLACSPAEMGTAFVDHLANCAELIDGAYEVLQALAAHSKIAIVTNGFESVQRGRMALSPIREFISELIISEAVGASKPKAAFFDAAMQRTGNPPKSDMLIIGDSLSSDMRGGLDYGIDTCWYNPAHLPRPENMALTYEIADLHELLTLVG